MIVQYKHKVMSSFLLWFDHELLKEGEAFTDNGSNLFNVNDHHTNLFTYGLPYKQIVSDTSVGAQVMSGIHVDGVFTVPGSGELVDINYENGVAYFNADQVGNVLSGDYSVKDFSVTLAGENNEEDLLFETKYELRPWVSQEPTGLPPESLTIPHAFIKTSRSENEEWAMGGKEETQTDIRVIVISNNPFLLDGLESIFVDARGKHICLLEPVDMPYNYLRGWISGIAYNYDGVTTVKQGTDKLFIENVFISRLSTNGLDDEIKKANPHVVSAFVDFELTQQREPRA